MTCRRHLPRLVAEARSALPRALGSGSGSPRRGRRTDGPRSRRGGDCTAGEANAECRSVARGRRGDGDRATVRTRNLLRNEESESEAMGPGTNRPTLAKRVEDERQCGGWNWLASIGDLDDDLAVSA